MKPALEYIRDHHRYSPHYRVGEVDLTIENDHNPLVNAPCKKCGGYGKHCIQDGDVQELYQCEACAGTGAAKELAPLFENNDPAVEVEVYSDGWVRCPNCNRAFALKDPSIWSGLRHLHCGQKLIPCRKKT